MITADKMFQDIRDFQPSLFHSREVAIATKDDVSFRTAYAEMATSWGGRTGTSSGHQTKESSATHEIPPQNEFDIPLLPSIQDINMLSHIEARRLAFGVDGRHFERNSLPNTYREELPYPYRFGEGNDENTVWTVMTRARFLIWLVFKAHYWRIRRIFIVVLSLLIFISSGTFIGLATPKLISILGTDNFLRWELPYIFSILIFFLLFQRIWGVFRAILGRLNRAISLRPIDIELGVHTVESHSYV